MDIGMHSFQRRSALSAKHVAFGVLVIGLVLAFAEVASMVFFTKAQGRFFWADSRLFATSPEQFELAKTWFDPELGWRPPRGTTPEGDRLPPRSYGRPFMATFGDSFTWGDEVEDNETWQTYLADSVDADVLNFGVRAYGTDQALLRYRSKKPTLTTPVVALGLILENINRTVSVYHAFYFPNTEFRMTKPRFVLEAGHLRLVGNPVQHREDIAKLRNPAFLHLIGRHDYWYPGVAGPSLVFPYSRLLFDPRIWMQAFETRNRRSSDAHGNPNYELWHDGDARALYLALLNSFVADARAASQQPLIVILPTRYSLGDRLDGEHLEGLDLLLRYCSGAGYLCFDGISYFAGNPANKSPDERARLFTGGHLSARGNQLVAHGLHELLEANKLLPHDLAIVRSSPNSGTPQ